MQAKKVGNWWKEFLDKFNQSTDLKTKMCQRLTTIKGDYVKSKEASWTTAKGKKIENQTNRNIPGAVQGIENQTDILKNMGEKSSV